MCNIFQWQYGPESIYNDDDNMIPSENKQEVSKIITYTYIDKSNKNVFMKICHPDGVNLRERLLAS